jgi:pyruvate dehydrogenase E2 component (dihydrolipoamide acetyltransferase)
LARRLAQAQNIDLSSLQGSGPGGRIVRADIDAAVGKAPASAPAAKPAAAPAAPVSTEIPHEAVKLSNMRKTIARRLTEAKQTIPHYYLTVDIQLDALLKLRSELNKGLESRGVKLSVNDLLIKALAVALIEVPTANVSFAGDQLIKYSRADISVAVAIPDGLITPIIVGADTKSLSVISKEMTDLAARAKDGKLQPHEYQGGTASLSNLGMFGTKQFDAVINPPQGMILAVGAGEKRPYVINDSLQIATVMSATGSFDHRAIDGAEGAKLMAAFKRLVENPLGMLA